jgi:hypothetical protein
MEASDAKPVAADAQPAVADAQPAVADTKPTAADTKPTAADTTKPVAADTEPPVSTQFATLGLHTMADPKASTDTRDPMTPPFSPSSQTPVLEKEQEDFQGTVHVDNSIPTEKDLARVADLLVLDAQGQSRPFKELYKAPGVAPRQLIIFIRHFFCGVSALQSPTSTHTPY